MGWNSKLWSKVTEAADLESEPCPKLPLVEIVGEHRVLVENHRGVCAYGTEEIGIRAGYGVLYICGQHLELTRMTGQQLLITGQIEQVKLCRRGG